MKNSKTLELTDLEAMLLSICSNLNRPIRKNQLIRMVTELFECNSKKQVEFAILNLIEHGQLMQKDFFIITPDFNATWDGTVTMQDEGIIKFLLSLKEEVKHDAFFDVHASECLTPSIFFKYVNMTYPALLHREDAAKAYAQQFDSHTLYTMAHYLYIEMNDYPTNRWFTKFFDNPDCRIIITEIKQNNNKHVSIKLMLLPGKKRSYKLAHEQYREFKEKIQIYFLSDVTIHFSYTTLSMKTGTKAKR